MTSKIYNEKIEYTRFGYRNKSFSIEELREIIKTKTNLNLIDRIRNETFKLYFDIDFANASEFIKDNFDNKQLYLDYVLENILFILNQYTANEEQKYYLIQYKSDNYNNLNEIKCHFIFYNFIVNKEIYKLIQKQVLARITYLNKFNLPIEQLNKIHDSSVSGLRIAFQTKPTQETFYYTIDTINEISDNVKLFELALLNSDLEAINQMQQIKIIDLNELHPNDKYEEVNLIKESSRKVIKSNEIDTTVYNIAESVEPSKEIKLLINEYLKYVKNYEDWIKIVFYCKNKKFYNYCYDISDHTQETNSIITSTFKTKNSTEKITEGSLIYFINMYNPAFIFEHSDRTNYDDFYNNNLKVDNSYDVNEKFINYDKLKQNNLLEFSTMFFKSSTGTGKSFLLKNLIKDLETILLNDDTTRFQFSRSIIKDGKGEKFIKILSICSLINMANVHYELLKDSFDIINYKTVNKNSELKKYNKLIVSLEKLKYLKDSVYNIVVIDEINAFYNRLMSCTVKERLATIEIFKSIVKNCNYLIISDNTINRNIFNYIVSLRNDKYFFYNNEYQNKQGVKANVFYNMNSAQFLKKSGIMNNDKNIVFSDTKSECDKLEKLFKSEFTYKITAERDDNLNEILKKDKFTVFVSPKIQYAYSIEVPGINIYCIYSTLTLNADALYQQTQRYRCTDTELNILFLTKRQYFNNKIISIDKDFYNKCIKENSEFIAKYIHGHEKELPLFDDDFKKLFYEETYKELVYSINKQQIFINMLEKIGYKIYFFEEEIKEKLPPDIKKLTQEEKIENINKIIKEQTDNLDKNYVKIILDRIKYLGYDGYELLEDNKENQTIKKILCNDIDYYKLCTAIKFHDNEADILTRLCRRTAEEISKNPELFTMFWIKKNIDLDKLEDYIEEIKSDKYKELEDIHKVFNRNGKKYENLEINKRFSFLCTLINQLFKNYVKVTKKHKRNGKVINYVISDIRINKDFFDFTLRLNKQMKNKQINQMFE